MKMNINEAINQLRELQAHAYDKDIVAIEIGINAMERTIPMKPVKSEYARNGMGYEYHDWECPNCHSFLAFEPNVDGIPEFCHQCGQSIAKNEVGKC